MQEAKDAGIPVILVDRMVDVADESLFTSWVGSDFELEGKKVTEWLKQYTKAKGIASKDIYIVNIQGTIGGSSQIGRSKGLTDAVKANGWNLLAEAPGDFTRAKGKEVMESFLRKYKNINVVYCENDNEAFGAIEAIEAAGKKVGSDIMNGEIMVVSFDGVKRDAMSYAIKHKIACIAECNPLLGPRVQTIIEQLEVGEIPEKFNYVDEEIFSAIDSVRTLNIDGMEYEVTYLTMFGFLKDNKEKKELNAIMSRIETNMANNYKDAAQEALKELEERLAKSEWKENQKSFYVSRVSAYKEKMKEFTHKDQKPYWT